MKKGYCYEEVKEDGINHTEFHMNDQSKTNHEVDRRHPGTFPESDSEDGAIDGLNPLYSPITTVGGQYITSITFAEPLYNYAENRFDLYPCYSMQLLVRTDDRRRFLYYDCFEYKPTAWKPDTGPLPTKKEHGKAMATLCNDDYYRSDDEDDDSPMILENLDDHEDYVKRKTTVKLENFAGEFMNSRIFRIQIPLSSLCRFRVHSPEIIYIDGDGEGPDEDQSVLILEFRQPASAFAVRCVAPLFQCDGNFSSIEDWTPRRGASRATRHYICGRTSEIHNIASHLAAITETPSPDVKPTKRRKSARLSAQKKQNTDNDGWLDVEYAPPCSISETSNESEKMDKKLSEDEVDAILVSKCGVTDVQSVSKCLKRGIKDGHIVLDAGLDTVVMHGRCLDGCKKITCTVGDILYQKDYAGMDYEQGGYDAKIRCPTNKCKKHKKYWCEEQECRGKGNLCRGIYVSRMCEGKPRFGNGKSHNHCVDCEGFGTCLGDYRSDCHLCGGRERRGKRVKDRLYKRASVEGIMNISSGVSDEWFPCPNCTEKFSSQDHLDDHIKRHHPVCQVCNKSFRQKRYLKQHMATHSEKRFKCSRCEKSFLREHYLNQHILTHSEETAFSCFLCQKSFSCVNSLEKHKVIHSDDRPFSCTQCSKSFKRMDYLYSHLVTHSDKRSFSCVMCDKSFKHKSSLTEHMATHLGEKAPSCLFICSICNKAFNCKSHLDEHMRIQCNDLKQLKTHRAATSEEKKVLSQYEGYENEAGEEPILKTKMQNEENKETNGEEEYGLEDKKLKREYDGGGAKDAIEKNMMKVSEEIEGQIDRLEGNNS